MVGSARPRHTYAQYVAIEQYSNQKHEFFDELIIPRSGGTEEHSALSARIVADLGAARHGDDDRFFGPDLRYYVEAAGMAVYPDASIIRGKLEQHPPSPEATARNPIVLVEVTSDSTEEYDRTTKLQAYQTIPTLQEYVIVSHRERRITVYRRTDAGWIMRTAIAGGHVQVEAVNATLAVDAIYRGSSIT